MTQEPHPQGHAQDVSWGNSIYNTQTLETSKRYKTEVQCTRRGATGVCLRTLKVVPLGCSAHGAAEGTGSTLTASCCCPDPANQTQHASCEIISCPAAAGLASENHHGPRPPRAAALNDSGVQTAPVVWLQALSSPTTPQGLLASLPNSTHPGGARRCPSDAGQGGPAATYHTLTEHIGRSDLGS